MSMEAKKAFKAGAQASRKRMWVTVVFLVITKTLLTSLSRGVYPFAEFIRESFPSSSSFSSENGVSETSYFLWIGIGEFMGGLVPLLSSWQAKVGPSQLLMVATLITGVIATAIGVTLLDFTAFVTLWILWNIVKTYYLAAHSAWIGVHVPRPLRPRVSAIGEFSWATAGFLGLPLIGGIISWLSEAWVFYFFGGLTILMAFAFSAVFQRSLVSAVSSRFPLPRARQGMDVGSVNLASTRALAHTGDGPHPEPKGDGSEAGPSKAEPEVGAAAPSQVDVEVEAPVDEPTDAPTEAKDVISAKDEAQATLPPAAAADKEEEEVLVNGGGDEEEGKAGVKEAEKATASQPTAVTATEPVKAQHPYVAVLCDFNAMLLIFALLAVLAGSILIFGTYSKWLDEKHNLSAGELGLASTSIGIAEVLAEIALIWATGAFDLGKLLLAVFVGATLAPLYIIAVEDAALGWNLSSLVLLFAFSELSIVTVLATGTTVQRTNQTAFFTVMHSAVQFGRFVGAVLVSPAYDLEGMVSSALFSSGLMFLGLVAAAVLVRRQSLQRKRDLANGGAIAEPASPPLVPMESPTTKDPKGEIELTAL